MEIRFDNVAKRYKGNYALKDFSATLGEGVFGLLGENGAGKTTLISILVGILRADGGTVRADGRDVGAQGRAFLADLGYMPQYPVFYRDFTVGDFLLYMGALKSLSPALARSRAAELLDTVNLADARDKKIGALSGGMRQRLGIAQAMLSDPKVLVLDEPTAGLDPGERIRFRNLISRFAPGRTILLATHIVPDVECIATEILLLRRGKLLMQGAPGALEQSIAGKVWEVTADLEQSRRLAERCCIGNMKQDGPLFSLRIVSDECPCAGARPAQPNLEDVFLYFCQDGDAPCA
ncbi:ATP-binding cassette domain-containing protein [Parvibacter caecicola]|uniref:ABC-2 type transport system ATP-binding protein n=1 Tax=Parvibacter caecicola TaxID=747645 RepID=A0A7W5GQU7_9ACTN|nr:ATP-binding cassette domain-containing protein [Parvibacter caecicola]MBB3171618.1 ABC-2 type transport system ATP-binding protein [Parvibacter caecicola]MCR2040878.1 ATP-binding cassette domain-containing protein [Parvibacter caecicola]RNL10697.1 ABC transporter ATP-binding protein [Parvibacter caecicola]